MINLHENEKKSCMFIITVMGFALHRLLCKQQILTGVHRARAYVFFLDMDVKAELKKSCCQYGHICLTCSTEKFQFTHLDHLNRQQGESIRCLALYSLASEEAHPDEE